MPSLFRSLRNAAAKTILAAAACGGLSGCHSIESWDNDVYGNFDALWTIMDTHYCFFREKGIDWEETGQRYRRQLKPDMDATEFFGVCADMLAELRDGHTNLSSWFDVSYYRQWWSDYPQNFNLRLIQENYLSFDYHSGGPIIYKILEDENIGYMHYSTFAADYGMAFLDNMLYSMRECDALIIDVRDNGGGNLTVVDKLVSQFIDQTITAGYICHKTGPGHDDFSRPFAYTIEPATGHVRWLKPVVVLTNRSTFSAANNFVSIMKSRKNTAIVGDITGGGSGMPFSSELPCGWGIRFSASPVYDAQMNLTENGVQPSDNCHVDMNPAAEARGRDSIVDFAIALIKASVKPAS